eukprot:Tamp_32496.p1 GENE.Tamp_32496~~Tamp_32496.p1  ORF type:complete len:113 (-),score=12.00 Tamp_32496:102-440(-)
MHAREDAKPQHLECVGLVGTPHIQDIGMLVLIIRWLVWGRGQRTGVRGARVGFRRAGTLAHQRLKTCDLPATACVYLCVALAKVTSSVQQSRHTCLSTRQTHMSLSKADTHA